MSAMANGLTRTVLRRWTATDQCGNSTNGVQTVTVVDTRKPSITSPNISVQCTDDVPAPYASLAEFLAQGGLDARWLVSKPCGAEACTPRGAPPPRALTTGWQ